MPIIIPLLFLLLSLPIARQQNSNSSIPLQISSQTISIQDTNETFFTYIPYSSDCSYPNLTSIYPGKVEYTPLDPVTIFESIEVVNEVIFWGTLVDGIRMLVNQQDLLQNGEYNQIVLFNSSIKDNFIQRELILVQYNLDGDIIFSYAEPVYNYSSNILTPSIASQQRYDLGSDIARIIKDCNDSGNSIKITYAGENIYLGLCPNTTNLFAWNASDETQHNIYSNLSFIDGDNIQNMTNNPELLVPNFLNTSNVTQQIDQFVWSVVFLSQSGDSCYFCSVNLTSITCQSHENEELWMQIVVERAWGVESATQISQLELILSEFPQIINYTFPGTIVSIFSYSKTIFIESNLEQTTYLSIFQNDIQLANTTLKGGIVYYGKENIIVEENNNFWLVDFILPMHSIQSSAKLELNYTLNITCSYAEYELVYNVFWTSIIYPSYLIEQVNNMTQTSYQNVKIDNLNNYFTIIGPAFEVFIGDNPDLDIDLIDISEMLGIEGIINVVSVIFLSQTQTPIPYYLIYIDLTGALQRYQFGSQQISAIAPPCGFSHITGNYRVENGFIFLSDNSMCFCNPQLTTCSIVSHQQLPSTVLSNTNSLAEYSITLNSILIALGIAPTPSSNDNAIKKQLLAVVNQDLIVNIYQNNTITLTNFQGNVIDYIGMNETDCIDYNSTDGAIFTRNFYDDYLIIYCYNMPTITQFLIRNEQFLFNRVIPLYGFLTVNNITTIFAGVNYVFLKVQVDPAYFGSIKAKTNSTNCCILRLDPDQFTVGVITEIILANRLLAVESMFGVDIVFYNQTEVSTSMPFIKIYFDSSWVTFQQPTVCTPQTGCATTTYQYVLTFISNFYNFGAMYNQSITFDINASEITYTSSPLPDVQLDRYVTNYILYNSSNIYNFNNFCGPIQSFHQQNQNQTQGNIFSIVENTIIIPNKEITNNYSAITQIMDIEDYAPGNSLASCIMVVGIKNLTFYLKYTDIWMSTLQTIESTQTNCVYFVNQIIDSNTIQFGSDCYNIQINTPVITVSYYPQADTPTFNYTFATMQLPIQLRSITSILNGNMTQLLGIQQGPSKSISGVLYLCNSVCNSLVINTKVVFFIDFDQQQTEMGLIIVGLDVYKLSFWINATISPASNASISADYIVDYQQQLGYSCSKVKIVYGSLTQPNIILSCAGFYQQLSVNLQTLTISLSNQLKFVKFANCEQIDRFKPQIILFPNTQSNIMFLAVECQQNIDIVRLEEIYSLNSNSTIDIVTGYLQIYTYTGPQCSSTDWYPIRIINLGTSEQFMSYLVYNSNSQWKLLYETINGILIDAFIDMTPISQYELIQLTKTIIYPQILMTVKNPYYRLGFTIQTNPQKKQASITYFYLTLSVFIAFNLVTVVFFFCWCFFSKNSKKTFNSKYFNDAYSIKTSIYTSKQSNTSKIMVFDKNSVVSVPEGDRNSMSSVVYNPSNANESVVNQLVRNNPVIKKRGTQIELFQPR